MEFQHEFDVKAPIDEVYAAMLDLERVTPAMPGAEVLEKTDDDHYKVGIKVKVGPISMQYRGDVEIQDKDPGSHSARIKVAAREARGQGTANADVDLRLEERGDATHGKMTSNVQLAGKAAAMGGGVIKDVSAKLVDQFARNLGGMLASEPAEATAATNGPSPPSPAGGIVRDGAPAASPPPPRAARQPQPSEDDGVDALGIAASVARDRFKDPRVVAGAFALVLLIGWLLGRRSAG